MLMRAHLSKRAPSSAALHGLALSLLEWLRQSGQAFPTTDWAVQSEALTDRASWEQLSTAACSWRAQKLMGKPVGCLVLEWGQKA